MSSNAALERKWEAYWNPAEVNIRDSGEILICQRRADSAIPVYKPKRFQFTQFTVEDESDNSEDEVEEISMERVYVVQAELEKCENLRKGFKPRETGAAGLNFDIAMYM
eukprot:Pgem_evm1s13347